MRIENAEQLTRQYEASTGRFYRTGHCWAMYESPVDIYGPIRILIGSADPYARDMVSRHLGVDVHLVYDIAHRLRMPDGAYCKPNWFDKNFTVLCDKEAKCAVAITPVVESSGYHYGNIQTVYASRLARPNGLYDIQVHRPNIKAGNAAIKAFAPLVGEARLRAGIMNWTTLSLTNPLYEYARNYKEHNILPDVKDELVARHLLNLHLDVALRSVFRDTITLKELVYEP